MPFIPVSLAIRLTKHYGCIEDWRGEAKEMKKALLCDTLSTPAMAHRRKTGVH
jgi:hypothetical protein